MTETVDNTNIVNRTDEPNCVKKSSEILRPHYYTTFQNYCCGTKSDPTTSTQNKDFLPIPTRFQDEAEDILNGINEVLIENLTKITKFTHVIPDKFFNDSLIQRYLIDRIMHRTMTDANIINWMPSLKKLYPIRTSGNGNCLLHAVLIAMVGIHDLNLNLRDRLGQFMDDNKDVLKNHWKTERLKSDKNYGISSDDAELDNEWNEVCNIVHYETSQDGQTATQLQYLEAVHIFSTSNMLRRPIIVLSEDIIRNKNGEPISVNDIYGIYLPILTSANECIREPIVLAYDQSHFCPLETSDIHIDNNILPLYLSINHAFDQILLPIRFLGEDGSVERSNNLLNEYLQIEKIEHLFDTKPQPSTVLCARLGGKSVSLRDNFFDLYYKYVADFFDVQKPKAIEEERKRERQLEIENYAARHGSYDVNNETIVIDDSNSSSLSPRSTNTINNNSSRNRNNYSHEDYVNDENYGNGTYVPRNGSVHIENPRTQPQQSKKPPDYAKATQFISTVNYDPYRQYSQSHPKTYSDNINNITTNGKIINTAKIDVREEDNKYQRGQQQQGPIPIPIHFSQPTTKPTNSGVFISQPKRYVSSICGYCKRLFEDTQPAEVCPDCAEKLRAATSRSVTSICGYCNHQFKDTRPSDICPDCAERLRAHASRYEPNYYRSNNQARLTNIHAPAYGSHYTVLSPTPTSRLRRTVHCPSCKSININSTSSNLDYYCSTCHRPIPTSALYY